LRFSITERPSCSRLDEVKRTGYQTNTTAIIAAKFHRERETILQLPGRLVDVADLFVGFRNLIFHLCELFALLIDETPTPLQFLVHRESEIKHSANHRERDNKCDYFGARIDLAHQFACELTEKDFRVVAPGSRCRFDGSGFDKRRHMCFTTGLRSYGRKVADRVEVQHEFRVADAQLVAVAYLVS